MKKHFYYKSYKTNITSVPQVMEQMQLIQKELEQTDLFHLQHFNITYLIITKNVYSKIGTGYFSDDKTMKQLDSNFAKFYFDALKQYEDTNQTTPAWKIMFDFCKQDTSLPLIYLALGVNAHVNNDLGLSLFDVVSNKNYKEDFNKVNKIISDSLDEVIAAVRVPKVYKPFMDILIKRWRKKAWSNFINLKEQTAIKKSIEEDAAKIANKLIKINSEKDFYHLIQAF